MNINNLLRISSQVAGVASAIPGFGQFATPISMGLNFASNMVDNATDKINVGGVDVTNQLKGPSMFNPSFKNISYPVIANSQPNTPQSQVVDNPYGMNVTGMVKNYNDIMYPGSGMNNGIELPNPLSTGNINVEGKGFSADNPYSSNVPLPQGYLTDNSKLPLQAIAELNGIMGNRNSIIPTGNQTTDNGQSEEVVGKQMLKNANEFAGTMDKIGTGAYMLGNALSLFIELNKKPSKMAVSPQYKTTDLDSNQSATINAGLNEIEKGKNFQQRLMMDLGIDPMLAGVMLESMSNDSKTKLLAESERTRQGIEATQEQINASIQAQGGQSKMATDQFNIQKQMQENQLASANISQSIMGMVNALPAYGQINFARKYQMYDLFYNR